MTTTPAYAFGTDDCIQSGKLTISFYENHVPAFAADEIDRLYGHLYSSPSYFELANRLGEASTYVASSEGKPVAIFLLTRTDTEVDVIGEYMHLEKEDVLHFADYIFGRFGSVGRITFNRVLGTFDGLRYPCHAVTLSEDMIVMLPPTVKEYDSKLGKNMRRNIKRYTSVLQERFPSYAYRVCEGAEISEQDIRDIIRLSCLRMEGKNIVPRFTEEETQWIADFARTRGLVGIVTIDGRVSAGAIGFRIGENYFMHVIAHDPQYNDYSLGILCYYRTICEGIARGAKRFHLLQGRYGYKYRLLAARHDVSHVDIYRSSLHAIARGPAMARMAMRGRAYAVKQWLLHDVERSEAPALRLIGRGVHALRGWKRSRSQRTSSGTLA